MGELKCYQDRWRNCVKINKPIEKHPDIQTCTLGLSPFSAYCLQIEKAKPAQVQCYSVINDSEVIILVIVSFFVVKKIIILFKHNHTDNSAQIEF